MDEPSKGAKPSVRFDRKEKKETKERRVSFALSGKAKTRLTFEWISFAVVRDHNSLFV